MQFQYLNARGGTEIMLIAVRSEVTDYLVPHTWTSSDRIEDFFQMSFGMDLGHFAGRLESYLLSGLSGT